MSKQFRKCCKNCSHLICVYILPNSRQLCDVHDDYFDTDSCCRSWEYGEDNLYLNLKEFEHLKKDGDVE